MWRLAEGGAAIKEETNFGHRRILFMVVILDAAMGNGSGRGSHGLWFWSGLCKVTKSVFVLEAAFVTFYICSSERAIEIK